MGARTLNDFSTPYKNNEITPTNVPIAVNLLGRLHDFHCLLEGQKFSTGLYNSIPLLYTLSNPTKLGPYYTSVQIYSFIPLYPHEHLRVGYDRLQKE
jgi:hypothetical protein